LNVPLEPSVLQKKYKEEFKKLSKRKYDEKYWNEHDNFNKYRKDIWDIHHKGQSRPWENEDEDIIDETQNTQMDVLCPIGRNVMSEPMKSKKCGHVFEKKNIGRKFFILIL
jgi:SUMO ligase MMS21 Smc5/6 complex component